MDWTRIEKEMHELETKLEYNFRDIFLLAEAMRSKKIEKKEYSNEALAFLGDTIIKFLIAKHLYGDGIDKRKGVMTKKKSDLENNSIFHEIMEKEKLISYSYHDTHFHMDNPPDHLKVVTNKHDPYIEAIAAAIYKDGGWEAVNKWFEDWLLQRLERYSVSN